MPSLLPIDSLPSRFVPRTNDSTGNTRQYHAIGFEAVVNSDTADYVHHLVLRAYTDDQCGYACSNGDSTTSSTLCNSNYADIFVWAPGSSDMALPDDVGFLLGNASGRFESLRIEIHYNNPDEVEGVIDDSGVRVYYTEELRPINMGVIQLGDPFVELGGTALPEGKSSYSFQCPSSCFETYFEVRSYVCLLRENLVDFLCCMISIPETWTVSRALIQCRGHMIRLRPLENNSTTLCVYQVCNIGQY